MAWWGKLIGGTLGFMRGGPLGALLGASFGHQFDSGRGGKAACGHCPETRNAYNSPSLPQLSQ
ncbi:MAG: hypothetical protein CM1200mP20_17390 [Pseudomonadota bacterium]|nr:MAG: hypothetical protein CM1200mP20_17390 [Pseudomonadota bacterium]